MRTFVAATVAATMIATSAFAAVNVAPLSAGKPAGVHKAQDADNTVWWVVGLGAVAAGIALVASSNSNGSVSSAATTTATQ